jgi:hypothetical protein
LQTAAINPQRKGAPMNAKNAKTTLKVAAVAAGLVAVLLPTGCSSMTGGAGHGGGGFHGQPAPGSAGTVVAPHTVD